MYRICMQNRIGIVYVNRLLDWASVWDCAEKQSQAHIQGIHLLPRRSGANGSRARSLQCDRLGVMMMVAMRHYMWLMQAFSVTWR